MKRFLARRLVELIPVVAGITLLTFLLIHLIPGDPVKVMLGERASPDEVARLRQQLGLDRSLPEQYVQYCLHAAQGDLGQSILRHTPVTEELARAFPATIELTLGALLIATVLGIPLGMAAAVRRGSWWDALCTTISLGGISMPVFWLGLMLVLLFPYYLNMFYFSGRASAEFPHPTGFYVLDAILSGNPSNLADALGHLVLPCLTLSTIPLAMIARMTRSSMLEVLSQDYIRTARAKGLTERQVLWGHALPNALIPIVTAIGLQFGYLLGGAVMTETVFAIDGVGRLVVESVKLRDYPLVQGSVLAVALAVSLVNVLVDLLYAWLDPRVRYG